MSSCSPLSEDTSPVSQTFEGATHADLYRMLVERLPAITYIAAWDEDSSTLYTSPQIERILGFARAEWLADPTRWLK